MHPIFLLLLLMLPTSAHATRAKDIGTFHGLQDNVVTGTGLVVGLSRTGDTTRNKAAVRSLLTRLKGMGVSFPESEMQSRNVAMVMVTANLPATSRNGGEIDVTVASTGDATSLEGGLLLPTPLHGMDGEIHALAEGSVIVGGFSFDSAGGSAKKAVPTVGSVIDGGTIVREVDTLDYNTLENVEFILDDPDFTTALRMADAINTEFNEDVAEPRDGSTIDLSIPGEYKAKFARFAARLELVEVMVDMPARVVIDERTGTVVMGADVQVSAVAVAHGALTIEVRRVNQVSQPAPLSLGNTAIIQNSVIDFNEEEGQLVLVEGVNIGDIVSALNSMGVKPRDLITILKAMRASGAVHAEIVTL